MNLIERQKWFINMRFGMFIHFNSATFQFATGETVDWEYDHENNGKDRCFPFDEKDWNPTNLDCDSWAKAAKSAKMEFAALTAKHHEGYALWPSEYTDHCVKNAAVKTDIVAEYLKAFRKEGIVAGLYFSMLDLHHQINKNKCTTEDKAFIKNQITELLTNYGEIPFLIIDGWQANWGGPSYENLPFEEIDSLVKELQPNCLLMNISCENNLNHTDMVFYENADGQEPEADFVGPGVSCNVLTNKNWFWRECDTMAELKSVEWALDKIEQMNKQNIAFILNISPNQQGGLDDNLVRRFAEIGERYIKQPDFMELPKGWITR